MRLPFNRMNASHKTECFKQTHLFCTLIGCFEEMPPNPFQIIIRRMGLCKTSCNYKISSEFIKLPVRYQLYVYEEI